GGARRDGGWRGAGSAGQDLRRWRDGMAARARLRDGRRRQRLAVCALGRRTGYARSDIWRVAGREPAWLARQMRGAGRGDLAGRSARRGRLWRARRREPLWRHLARGGARRGAGAARGGENRCAAIWGGGAARGAEKCGAGAAMRGAAMCGAGAEIWGGGAEIRGAAIWGAGAAIRGAAGAAPPRWGCCAQPGRSTAGERKTRAKTTSPTGRTPR